MIVYHGNNKRYGSKIYCPVIYYEINRGNKMNVARKKAQYLLDKLINFDDPFLLQMALDNAQRTGVYNPFISTSPYRNVARSFALNRDGQGYIYTIEGPETEFYDFNKIRRENNLPQHRTFNWMNELGIKVELVKPFEIVKIEHIIEIQEKIEVIFDKNH